MAQVGFEEGLAQVGFEEGLDVKQDFLRDAKAKAKAKAKTAPLEKHEFHNGIKKLNNLTYL